MGREGSSERAEATRNRAGVLPAFLSVPCSATSMEWRTAASGAEAAEAHRSPTTGSTRGCSAISKPSALAARSRTALAGSDRHFTNVVWSCGKNGLSAIPPWVIMMASVLRMAAFT